MWNRVIAIRLILCCVCVFLISGCWITRNWKDYLPIADMALMKEVKTYSGFFYPQHNGVHALSLAIKSNSPDTTQINLCFKGEIKITSKGRTTIIPFEQKYRDVWLPRTRFKLYLKTFYAESVESSDDRGSFHLKVDGDLAEFLDREPDSSITVSLIDCK